MILNPIGQIAAERWTALSDHHPGIDIDSFIVMPNHVHAIILVGTGPALSAAVNNSATKTDNAGIVPTARTPILGTFVGSYKSSVSRRIRELLGDTSLMIWQTRYHDHIIRDEKSFLKISEYILNNPARWHEDTFYSAQDGSL